MNIPDDLLYTEQHEWIRIEGAACTVGITDYAQNALGDLTFVELPEVGRSVKKGEEVVVVESCKAAAGIYSPVGGKILAVNDALDYDPEPINSDPYGQGWMCKIAVDNETDLSGLMKADRYADFCGKDG